MKTFLSYALLSALLVHVGVHVSVAVGLVQRRAYARAALAFFVAPLAPWWGWEAGMRRRVLAWGASLAVYALLVVLA